MAPALTGGALAQTSPAPQTSPAQQKSSVSPDSIAPMTQQLQAVGGMQTPRQPTANDPSVGIPGQPATMGLNPEAMSPDAARVNGTAPVNANGK